VIFLSCKANARVCDAKSGHGPYPPPSPKRLEKSRLPPVCGRAILGSEPRQPTKKSLSLPKLVQGYLGAILGKISQGFQPDFKIVSVSIFLS